LTCCSGDAAVVAGVGWVVVDAEEVVVVVVVAAAVVDETIGTVVVDLEVVEVLLQATRTTRASPSASDHLGGLAGHMATTPFPSKLV
jgi:hypothetical protein